MLENFRKVTRFGSECSTSGGGGGGGGGEGVGVGCCGAEEG